MSPTIPKSATLNIGASGSVFIATNISLLFIPTKCCIAPLIPKAIYNFGLTVFPD